MEPILFLAAIVTLSIVIVTFFPIFKKIKKIPTVKKEVLITILGLTYIIFTAILFLWAYDFLIFDIQDFSVVLSIILIAQAICLITILHKIRKNKKTLYALIPLSLIIPITLNSSQAIHLAIPISLLSILLSFLLTLSIHEKITRYIILYISLSLFLYTLAIFYQDLIPTLILIFNILSLFFIIPFIKVIEKTPQHHFSSIKKESLIVHFLKHFIFIIIITNFVFIGTVSVHEFGHLITSSHSDCEQTRIIYELQGLPHTEVKCKNTEMQGRWIAGGIFLPLALAFFLLFSGGKFIREIALQIVGFDLIISYIDIVALGFSTTFATFILIIGAVSTITSIALLAKSRIE